ncbi:MAG: hypothetical protein WBA39_03045, partial [Rivularia sp. (in: cyanobacteria)]
MTEEPTYAYKYQGGSLPANDPTYLTYLLFLKERGFLDASLGCATLRSLTIPPRPFRVSQCPRLTI